MEDRATNIIREAIFQLLTKKGIKPSGVNVQYIFLQHLAGNSDKPLIDLIDEMF